KQLEVALKRKRALDTASHTPRTGQRLRAAVDHAKNAGINELKALAPRYNECGNRESLLTPEQEAAMTEVINNEYLKSNAPSVSNCHIRLVALCKERSIKAPSRPTLAKRIKALNQKSTDMARFGKRVAYQNSDFVHTLDANTPIHGSRAFQYVHMDHTLLDVSLQDRETGRSLGRPWLSLAVCAYSRRELGRYLSFDPPSYRSNMMLLRDIVRRHQRLPQFIVVDN